MFRYLVLNECIFSKNVLSVAIVGVYIIYFKASYEPTVFNEKPYFRILYEYNI